jgi:FAD/FMN-containing dehydrogenase
MPAPTPESIEALKAAVRGEVLLSDSAGYDEARSIWNAMIDKRPAVIIRCTGVADVITAVNYGRNQGLVIAVHGGGHNIAGNAVCDDGLMIDLSLMNSVHVDPATKRAYVGPGATLGDVDHETAVHGLATPTGINSTTGIAGLTLGGGFGWLSRQYGLTVDNVVSMEVVTAEGKRVRASNDENTDLFWALRGGGGNFGIVTLFEYQLHEVGPNILAGLMVFPGADAKSILTQYRDLAPTMPEELSVWVVTRGAPPLPFLPESVHGTHVIILAFCYTGDPIEGERLIAPLRDFGRAHGLIRSLHPVPATTGSPIISPNSRTTCSIRRSNTPPIFRHPTVRSLSPNSVARRPVCRPTPWPTAIVTPFTS